ncbi:hypothetical protein BHM03_00045618 [Ensete ventricosum]|nr:hypothetical protein BHM03_00045618 [Ensete ventricosum]
MLALRNPMALAVICQNRGHSRLRLAVQKKMVRCEMGGVRSGHCGFDRGSSNRGRPMTQRPWLPVEQRGERVQILSPWLRQRKQRPGEADGSETMVADSDMMQGAAEDEKEEEATVASEGGKGVVEPMIGASKVVSLATSSSIAERVAEVTTARGKSSRHSAGSEVVAHVGEGAIPRLEAVGGHKPGEDVDREGNGAAGQLWRAEEDAILRTCMKQYGPREWNLVSQRMNVALNRDTKSCLGRWKNHLRSGIEKDSLTKEEQHLVIWLQLCRKEGKSTERCTTRHSGDLLSFDSDTTTCSRQADLIS